MKNNDTVAQHLHTAASLRNAMKLAAKQLDDYVHADTCDTLIIVTLSKEGIFETVFTGNLEKIPQMIEDARQHLEQQTSFLNAQHDRSKH